MHLHLPLFPKKKKRRTNPIKPTEQILLQPPLKLLQFHFSLHKVDTLIFKSRNLLTPPKRLLSTHNY